MKLTLTAQTISLGLACAAHAAPLKVDLSGVEARGGKLYISVQTEDQFMTEEGIGEIIVAPEAGTHSFTYDVPEGRYAVSVWHDDNANEIFDTSGEYDMPEDGWAMHNGLSLRAAPTFDAVSLEVTSDGAAVSERITYGR